MPKRGFVEFCPNFNHLAHMALIATSKILGNQGYSLGKQMPTLSTLRDIFVSHRVRCALRGRLRFAAAPPPSSPEYFRDGPQANEVRALFASRSILFDILAYFQYITSLCPA